MPSDQERKQFLDAVRTQTKTAVWAKGVKLADEHAVTLREAGDGEETYAVRSPGVAVAPVVTLYLNDGEWACDCASDFDPCEHVAAAAIAARKASALGGSVKTTGEVHARLGYFLRRDGPSTVAIDRFVVAPDGTRKALEAPLATLVARGRCPVQPTHQDLAVDGLLLRAGQGATRATTARSLSVEGMTRLLEALANSSSVTLDDREVKVSAEPLVPPARIEDHEAGVRFIVERPPELEEVLDRGLGLAGGTLHPLGAPALAGPRFEHLPLERKVSRADLGAFVDKVLPELEKVLPIEIATKRLPRRERGERPRIDFGLATEADRLTVLPTLVYGMPVIARVDAGRLVVLGKTAPVRDERAEHVLVQRVRDELDLAMGRSVTYQGADAARFMSKLERFGGASTEESFVIKMPLALRVAPEGDGSFSLGFSSDDGTVTAKAEAVLWAYRSGVPLVPLDDGRFAPLPADWMTRYANVLEDLLAARGEAGTVAARSLHLLAELAEDPALTADLRARVSTALDGFQEIPRAAVPEHLGAILRPYQWAGVDWLGFLRDRGLGGVLADDMGLGKTLMTIASMRGRTLVVCPRSLVFNWRREIERFRPELRVNVLHGPSRRLDDADVTITTYSVLRGERENLTEHGFDMLVLDEAQAIKNADSQTARAAFALSDAAAPGTFRLALSGTPVENRLEELWSVLRFAAPGLLGARETFLRRYEAGVLRGETELVTRLRRIIKPFLLRRLKKDVLTELPPRTHVTLSVELDPEERRIYDALHAAKREEVRAMFTGGERKPNFMLALEALLRLRQAACHVGLVPGQERTTSSKVETLVEALDQAAAEGHRALVFSQWTGLLDRIEPELDARGIRHLRLDGTTKDREGVVGRFQAPDGPPVLLASLKAGGTGLNLTAADHVFLVDPWWNPAAEDQASDRAHRIGQERPVTVYRLVSKGTVEERIVLLQEQKRALADALLDGGGASGGLTEDDLLALFEP